MLSKVILKKEHYTEIMKDKNTLEWKPDSPRILYFEDDKHIAEIYTERFNKLGYDVKHFVNPPPEDMIVDFVLKLKPHILIFDILMAEVDGWTAGKIIKKDNRIKNIPLIYFDSLCREHEVRKSKEIGDAFYCQTEVTPNRFVDAIKLHVSYLEKNKR